MKTALVTGASSGIGLEIAWLLARDGYDLVLAARRLPLLEQHAAAITEATGQTVIPLRSDLAEPDGASTLVDAIQARNLRIDYLVNNAGVTLEGRYLDNDWESQRAFVQLMSLSPAELTHRLLPAMVDRGHGAILNVASLGAFWPAFPGITLYAGAKSFLVRLTNTLAVEYARTGVTFTVICPFTTRTAFLDGATIAPIAEKMPKFMIQSPELVARIGVESVRQGKTLVHTSILNRVLAGVLTVLPVPIVNRGLVKYMSLGRDDLV
ncbi:SDR family NAD(P)-dependent oxidoreductase [Mycobacterium sp.]|uniref:SDR family NAD(P)-dependent oxidoreductase n=1 Tax=Mycobacterium sp. TaxID=1785 RepID=UPI00121BCC14|nr:SDR family NAD(P)-dependent oxidoreductase [Mycobacterium sp.]TAM70245.1 MAG: SDR family NAD(P)-dependent oxidoreductase [Mycobacterium sp.]